LKGYHIHYASASIILPVSQLYTPYTNGQPQTQVMTRYYFGFAYELTGSAVTKYYSFAGQTIAMKNANGLQFLFGVE